MIQVVEHLLSKCEVLSSNPRMKKKNRAPVSSRFESLHSNMSFKVFASGCARHLSQATSPDVQERAQDLPLTRSALPIPGTPA
jgi:hypothetical protein